MVLVTGFKHGTAKTIQDLPGAFWATLDYIVEVFLSSISGLPLRRPLRYGLLTSVKVWNAAKPDLELVGGFAGSTLGDTAFSFQ